MGEQSQYSPVQASFDKSSKLQVARRPIVTAILIDGGFYRKRSYKLFGNKTPEQRADELIAYCRRHIQESQATLYRIFYYDCPPSEKVLFHPLFKKQVNLAKSDQFKWTKEFFERLVRKRKVALRRGEELETQEGYVLRADALKKLLAEKISIHDLTERDFLLDITQKGVDMRLGLDIATLAERHLVNQIIMISGDSDFVPAAKYARRAGVDFILDPMWAKIAPSLSEHIDGIRACVLQPPNNEKDPLHVKNMGSAIYDVQDDDEEF